MIMDIITRKAAKAAGLKRYFTGRPCDRGGHIAERHVQSKRCIICNREDTAVRNRDRDAERAAVYDRKRHSENISQALKLWHSKRVNRPIHQLRPSENKEHGVGRSREDVAGWAWLSDAPKATVKGARVIQGWRSK